MMFPPDLSQMTAVHLQALIDDQVPEGPSVEYKEALPASKRSRGDQPAADGTIPEHARNKLLAEICAFANSQGGHVVVGMAESEDNKRLPVRLTPLAQVEALAIALRHQIRDCVDPPLPHVQVAAVSVGDAGAGVLVIRVPESYAGPHRVETTNVVPIRQGDRCEELRMRQIQDLTLQRATGLTDRLALLERRSDDFRQALSDWSRQRGQAAALGIRVAAVPTNGRMTVPDLLPPAVFSQGLTIPYWRTDIRATIGSRAAFDVGFPMTVSSPRPILRGVVADQVASRRACFLRAYQDGSVEYRIIISKHGTTPLRLVPEWLLGMLANAVFTAHELRRRGLAPATEYAVSIEVVAAGESLAIAPFKIFELFDDLALAEENSLRLPLYQFGDLGTLTAIAHGVITDLHHATGHTWPNPVQLEVPAPLLDHWRGMGNA